MKKRFKKPRDFHNSYGCAWIWEDIDGCKYVFTTHENLLSKTAARSLGKWLLKASEYLDQENRRKK